jgi:ABC-type uncharacterized transport system substrate-binding protein
MAGTYSILRRLAMGASLIAACALLLLWSDANRARSPGTHLPRVAVFQFNSQAILDEGVQGVLDSVHDHGFVDGRTIRVQRFNAENDLPTGNSIARELTSGRFDYVLTVSTNCLQAVAKANQPGRVKHVFGVVADPVGAGVGINPNPAEPEPNR